MLMSGRDIAEAREDVVANNIIRMRVIWMRASGNLADFQRLYRGLRWDWVLPDGDLHKLGPSQGHVCFSGRSVAGLSQILS
jgi:hypothetical protein